MTDDEKKHDRVNMNWPIGLKDRVVEITGARGVTQFAIEAVEQRLSSEDRAQLLEKEINELRYFSQLVLDRYVMGGDHENREAFLMELDLPAWLRTEGWPSDLAKLVPVLDPISTPVLSEGQRVPTQPPAPITGEPKQEYSDADLRAPSYVVAGTPKAGKSPMPASPEVLEAMNGAIFVPGRHDFVRSAEGSGKVCMADGCAEGPDHEVHTGVQTPVETPAAAPLGRDNPSYVAPSDDFLARVQAKAAEKGIDVSGAGLVPASRVATPEKPPVHNHAWVRHDDKRLHCDCGAVIDEPTAEHPAGIVREPVEPTSWDPPAEVPTEPAPVLDVPAEVPTPVAPPARSLDEFDVDF